MIELVPVVEMFGADYSERRVPDGVGSRREDPAAWDAHQRRCLEDAGVVGLVPVVPGSPMVPLGTLPDAAIAALVAVTLGRYDIALGELGGAIDIEDMIGALDGGFVLRHDGVVVVEPGCCCGLDSLGDWEAAAASAAWREVWVGHDGARLELRRAHGRTELRWGGVVSGGCTVAPDVLEAQLRAARAQLVHLAARVSTALPAVVAPAAARVAVARRLAGI